MTITADFIVMFSILYHLPNGCRRSEHKSTIIHNVDYTPGWKKRIQEQLDVFYFGLEPRIISCGIVTNE